MACEICRMRSRTVVQAAMRAGSSRASLRAPSRTDSFLGHIPSRQAPLPSSRPFSSTSSSRFLGRVAQTYQVVGATERLAKICMAPADYSITKEQRKDDEVEVLEDGEEVGRPIQPGSIWHTTFQLKPSFSTWSHVSMLHMYLLNTRLRCFERDQYRTWHQQLIDHFFFECEKKMHVDHNITSSALRQRYLKDIFTQFRGLLLAYDEGLVKGDAVLASALWRNLFKGVPDVDPRALAAIVGWMREATAGMERLSDTELAGKAQGVLMRPVSRHWNFIAGPEAQSQAENGAEGVLNPHLVEAQTAAS